MLKKRGTRAPILYNTRHRSKSLSQHPSITADICFPCALRVLQYLSAFAYIIYKDISISIYYTFNVIFDLSLSKTLQALLIV